MIADRLTVISFRTLLAIGCILFGVAAVSSFFNSAFILGSPITATFGAIFAFAVAIGAAFGINRLAASRPSAKVWPIAIVLTSAFSVRLAWILWIDTPPASDFLFMYNAALSAAAGDFSFNNTEYFSAWVYQMGFTMYEALIISVFNDPMLVLKLVNVMLGTGAVGLVYAAAAAAFNKQSALIAALFCAFYVPNIMMSSVLSNQHLSMFFFMLGCLLAVKSWRNRSAWLFIGLCFGLGQLFRPIGTIYLIALVIFVLLYELLPKLKIKEPRLWLATVSKLAGAVAIFYLLQMIVSASFMQAGYTEYPLSSREPYWKFVVGLNTETDGQWSLEDAKHVLNYKLGEERDQAELAIVKERLADKGAVAALFARKLYLFWGAKDDAAYWSLSEMNRPALNNTVVAIERATYIAMSVFGLFALLFLFRERKVSAAALFLLLAIGYALIHLAIEIQARYRLDIMPAYIVLQSYGVFRLQLWMQRKFNKQPSTHS
ncbi:glycosyltransferase family 39 protein [Paenibacillus sp. NEAU-GSW1]|uniref:ArnT family glycosyltransferase n=1 Tax=Paenibacillus sp. NEAU-GSW1 TaxID=2682486 RepID=UPI0012E2879C|nr:glycosyltransferase family 39 protein [Paenibacillus sp. NEAU-GSW1]MUT64480.1 hypothetical protein [Paenibacillus sp. NEAU-GSW1]